MASSRALQDELQSLLEIFNKQNERFQIHDSKGNAFAACFLGRNDNRYEIKVRVSKRYPSVPPKWSTESKDRCVKTAIKNLKNTRHENDNRLTNQVNTFLKKLCAFQNLPLPSGLDKLVLFENESEPPAAAGQSIALQTDQEKKKCFEKDNVLRDDMQMLDRVEQKLSQTQSSTTDFNWANHRLMQELNKMLQSDEYLNNVYAVDLVDDSLYEWNIFLKSFDKDSRLHSDLQTLAEETGKNYVQLNLTFKTTFPFHPPFVRVVYPVLSNGFVQPGGAICMELITKGAWSPAYNLEALVIQISATISRGNARVNFNATRQVGSNGYTMARAKKSFKWLTKYHEKEGWHTPPKNEG